MNFNLVKKNNAIPDSQKVKSLSDLFGLHPVLAELLVLRGVDTEEKVRKYLQPNIADLYDPFLMKGMSEAVERIKIAIEEKQ